MTDLQTPFDVAVVMPTILRPCLDRAVRSVFGQDLDSRVQLMIGIDRAEGDREILDELRVECPANMALTVLDPGYSTSALNGGLYRVRCGGSLRTVLGLLANSRFVAYLDDDNWWAPDHLSSLRAAIEGFSWAYSMRWYVDPRDDVPFAVDRIESTGPGCGIYADIGGFVDTNCMMIDKLRCHWLLPAWCVPGNAVGDGEDRMIFNALCKKGHPVACTGRPTAFYSVPRPIVDSVRAKALGERP